MSRDSWSQRNPFNCLSNYQGEELYMENPPSGTQAEAALSCLLTLSLLVSHYCIRSSSSSQSHLLVHTTQWFSALILEDYMTLSSMPWRIPPWGTWNHIKNTFPYSHIITKEAWTWPLQGESSRAQARSHPSLTSLQGTMPLPSRDWVSHWYHSTGGESKGWIKAVNGERREWRDEGWGCDKGRGARDRASD